MLKFFKAKRIECTNVADEAVQDSRDREAEGGAEVVGDKAAGKSVEGSVGESADRRVGRSSGKGGVVDGANGAQEMIERARGRPAGKRARSGLAESTSASMGWD